ncbi:acetyl esterase/lipase [Rathayibacter sp. PhB152]|uniref:alpha/beta hydrolase n=1 Tax=Rathayibacter sp. PhB152 TaxID=2485190 RepID=UPI000F4BF20B|nr:alpha/beta hydrolase [Rathayibacter sp. PhB152]ROQ59092.1 acetyl esterase/lipase [Rathayibacter sp. PhB152]
MHVTEDSNARSIPRPPFDPRVQAGLNALADLPIFAPLTSESIPTMRGYSVPEDISALDLEQREYTLPSADGTQLALTVLRRKNHAGAGPGILHIHGGGMVMGDRMTGISLVAGWVLEHDAVVATVEYRLAPEHPDPTPVEDCYAALLWIAANADDIGIDQGRILIAGASAGGGLAAGVALLARDRRGPALLGQLLLCPMIDDRDATVSTRQFDGIGLWARGSNSVAWKSLLGGRRGTDDVSAYAAPARATDLTGLPPTYLDVGSAEVFRDEVVSYASSLWRDGGDAELHVWPGMTHGWEALMHGTPLAELAAAARDSWVARLLESSTSRSA